MYKVASRLPSVMRGTERANAWVDSTSLEPRIASAHVSPSPATENPLQEYFDSVKQGRGIWKWTHYFDIYHRHFKKFVGKTVNVVEVGIYSGGSLEMWKAYFGRECRVYGVDVEAACRVYEGDRTRVFIGDQGDRKFWEEFRAHVPIVDVLIDDGGHLPEQQIVTLEEMLPHLRPDGVYMCEDVHGEHNRFSAYVHGLGQALNAKRRGETEHHVITSGFQKAISSIHQYPYVTVIEKNSAPVDQLIAPKRGTEWQPFL